MIFQYCNKICQILLGSLQFVLHLYIIASIVILVNVFNSLWKQIQVKQTNLEIRYACKCTPYERFKVDNGLQEKEKLL
jgi:hypothetical protein